MLGPTDQENIMRARADLRLGIPILLVGNENNAIIAPLEVLSQTRLDQLKSISKNSFILITAKRAQTLKCPIYDGNFVRLELGLTPKIASLKAIADPSLDLKNPLKGPFKIIRGKSLKLETEALLLLKSAQLLPAAVISPVADGECYAQSQNITCLQTGQVIQSALSSQSISDAITAEVPTARTQNSQFHIFRPNISGEEHYAVEIGKIDRNKPTLVRIHSACFTGDVLGSLKCDCGPQLDAALKAINECGWGALLYLRQEGRGIGLHAKIQAYRLQDGGADTLDANLKLGLPADARDYSIAAQMLQTIGVEKVALLTNNPDKVSQLEGYGVSIAERVPLIVGIGDENVGYLRTKGERMGHAIAQDDLSNPE